MSLQSIDVDKLHRVLLTIADEFHKICVKNDIPYYMLGGTMLGTIRHGGFIPWDDDMDFGVAASDFERLKECLREQLPANMRVRDYDDSSLNTEMIKIELLNSRMLQSDDPKEPAWGIFIDIFPLFAASDKKGFFSENKRIYFMVKYNTFAFPENSGYTGWRGVIQKVVKALNPLKKATLLKKINRLSQKHIANGTDRCVANHYGFWTMKEIVDKDIFGDPKLYKFEDREYYGVTDTDRYLKSLYGDYMQLPPENKRHLHCIEIKADESIIADL